MKMMMLSLVILMTCSFCTTRAVAPTSESRRTIDTIYQARILAMQTQLDEDCQTYMDSIYKVVVDSLMMERTTEMRELVK